MPRSAGQRAARARALVPAHRRSAICILLRPQGLIHGLVLRVLHTVLVHLVEVHGVVMVVMKMIIHLMCNFFDG